MILGTINPDLEGVLELSVLDHRQHGHSVQAVVDTGYNLFLTLPRDWIDKWRLPWRHRSPGTLADGSEVWLDTFAATVIWDGEPCRIEVDATEGDPLIGMSLLNGFDLHMRVKPGGRGAVQRTPPPRSRRRIR